MAGGMWGACSGRGGAGACFLAKGDMYGKGRACMCNREGMHGKGGHVWQRGNVWQRGACVVKGGMCNLKNHHALTLGGHCNGMHTHPLRFDTAGQCFTAGTHSYWRITIRQIKEICYTIDNVTMFGRFFTQKRKLPDPISWIPPTTSHYPRVAVLLRLSLQMVPSWSSLHLWSFHIPLPT